MKDRHRQLDAADVDLAPALGAGTARLAPDAPLVVRADPGARSAAPLLGDDLETEHHQRFRRRRPRLLPRCRPPGPAAGRAREGIVRESTACRKGEAGGRHCAGTGAGRSGCRSGSRYPAPPDLEPSQYDVGGLGIDFAASARRGQSTSPCSVRADRDAWEMPRSIRTRWRSCSRRRFWKPSGRNLLRSPYGSSLHHAYRWRDPHARGRDISLRLSLPPHRSMKHTKNDILRDFAIFSVPTGGIGGIGSWLTKETHDDVFARLGEIDEEALSAVQLNQLLVLGREAPVEDGFFRYYWLTTPKEHPYSVVDLHGFSEEWLRSDGNITSLAHLRWGLYRLYVDALLYFGNVRTAFRELRDLPLDEIRRFFRRRRFDTDAIMRRGPSLPLRRISKDNRYLISELACKSYGDSPEQDGDLRSVLEQAYKGHVAAGLPPPTIRELLKNRLPADNKARQQEFIFSAEELLDETVKSESDLALKYAGVAAKFNAARSAALDNTRYYLSMVSDLDVYVATSMRTRQDFRNMADACEAIFGDRRLAQLNLRYFDPTLSAARGHEDKGLIECLMVKCAKLLVYCAGEKESYGKDAEAAMALSLGKPVIFYCDQEQRSRFYREVHPLSRLIEFSTGVAVGAMVTDKLEDVSELIRRIFENQMVYRLEQPRSLRRGTLLGRIAHYMLRASAIPSASCWGENFLRRRLLGPGISVCEMNSPNR